jgi:molecular chaperone GrpE
MTSDESKPRKGAPPEESPGANDQATGDDAAALRDAVEDEAAAHGEAMDMEEAAPNEDGEEEETDPVAMLTAEAASLKDQLLRALAETDNTRRRAERDRAEASKYGVSGLARDLLVIVDNLRRAIESVPEDRRGEESIAALLTGVEMIEREFLNLLERYGVKRIEALGEKFDHNLHQAMFEVPTADQPDGTVAQVMQPGYVIADRLLRPALVGVAKAPPPGEEPGEEPGKEEDAEAGPKPTA